MKRIGSIVPVFKNRQKVIQVNHSTLLKVYQFRHLRITPPATLTGLLLGLLLYLEVLGYFFDHVAFWICFVLVYLGVTNYILLKIYRRDALSPDGEIVNILKYAVMLTGGEKGPQQLPAVWSWRNLSTRPILAVVVANAALALYILICHTPGVSSYIFLILSLNMALYLMYYLSCKMYYRQGLAYFVTHTEATIYSNLGFGHPLYSCICLGHDFMILWIMKGMIAIGFNLQ